MNLQNYDKLVNYLLTQIKSIHSGTLYKILKKDKRIKTYLGVKKLRKKWIDNLAVKGYVKGKGSITDPEQVKEILDKFFSQK